jgi:ferrous iron transport protein B
MSSQILSSPLVALVGNPNCGKTALFNRLTGARQKVANYAGVTVERKEGTFASPTGRQWRVLDLPGAYSLIATTPDEAITRDVIIGRQTAEQAPDGLVCVVNAANLRLSLRMVLELKTLGRPMVLALNMMDVARRRGIAIDRAALSRALGIPVVETIAVRHGGDASLIEALEALPLADAPAAVEAMALGDMDIEDTQRDVRRILDACVKQDSSGTPWSERVDRIVLHPVVGPLLLAVLMFLVFQAVFSWAKWPMDVIKDGATWVGHAIEQGLPAGLLRGLLVDGIVAGVGSVLVFMPQILILFFFILLLEDSGYLPRAAFLLDRIMGSIGLSGRSFIPLLSSFACAIPGIMATRTIPNLRDRRATMLLAPLMTCSARLPVYALLTGAFVPARSFGPFNLRGLVLFALYLAGVFGAVIVALVMKRFTMRSSYHPLMMELPEYHWPNARNLLIGLWERMHIFLARVGTIILALMVLLWFLASYPLPPAGAGGVAIEYSFAGMIGRGLQHVFAPLGFNWQICIALVPGLAAREVAISALGTVYALSGAGGSVDVALRPMIAAQWSLATALSLLAWYVFAPQCLSTLVTVRRESNSWRYPAILAGYLFAMAFTASFLTYHIALALGAG